MKTYANRTGHTVYANAGTEKRSPHQAISTRLYKNTAAVRRPVRNTGTGNIGPVVDSIIRSFKGTIVTTDISDVTWGMPQQEFFL